MATNPRNIVPAIALACCFFALSIAWSGNAGARTGVAPVVVEAPLDIRAARAVEEAVLRTLLTRGVNPPRSAALLPHLGLASPTEPPTMSQCVAAGAHLGLDVVVVVRVRLDAGEATSELRVVVVETGKEYRYTTTSDVRHAPRAVGDLVARVFDDVRAWNTDLVDVERALGRDCDEEYTTYAKTDFGRPMPFKEYMYLMADRRRRNGKAIAIVAPTILAVPLAALIYAMATEPWKPEHDDGAGVNLGGGFGEMFAVAGVAFATILCVAGITLSVGLGMRGHNRGRADLARLRPLVPNPPEEWRPEMELSMAPYVSPEGGGLALDLRF